MVALLALLSILAVQVVEAQSKNLSHEETWWCSMWKPLDVNPCERLRVYVLFKGLCLVYVVFSWKFVC